MFDEEAAANEAAGALSMRTVIRLVIVVSEAVATHVGTVSKGFVAAGIVALVGPLSSVRADVSLQGGVFSEAHIAVLVRTSVRALTVVFLLVAFQREPRGEGHLAPFSGADKLAGLGLGRRSEAPRENRGGGGGSRRNRRGRIDGFEAHRAVQVWLWWERLRLKLLKLAPILLRLQRRDIGLWHDGTGQEVGLGGEVGYHIGARHNHGSRVVVGCVQKLSGSCCRREVWGAARAHARSLR